MILLVLVIDMVPDRAPGLVINRAVWTLELQPGHVAGLNMLHQVRFPLVDLLARLALPQAVSISIHNFLGKFVKYCFQVQFSWLIRVQFSLCN